MTFLVKARQVDSMNHQILLPIMLVGILSLSLLLSGQAMAGDREAQVARCQVIKNKIQHYTAMRRGGGSSSEMRGWQSRRNDYKQKYRDQNCTRVRTALK
ncbi:hypothetical protein [Cobetia crustatorum]|nr:hypothetical protein [Cobetia crustatorum]